MQPADFIDGDVGAGRIGRVRQEDDLGALGDRRENGIDIDARILLLDGNGRRARRQDLDLVDEEAMLGDDAFVAGPEIGVAEKPEQLVRPIAAHDVCRVEAVHSTDRLSQRPRLAIRITFEVEGSRLEGLDRLRACAKRCLVGRELMHLGDTRRVLLARHISGNIQDAGTRLRALRSKAHRVSFLWPSKCCSDRYVPWEARGAAGRKRGQAISGASGFCRGSAAVPRQVSGWDAASRACSARPAAPAPARRRGAMRVRRPAAPGKAASAPRRR
ncbi:hypothetical protein D9M72_414300 [compost metagenome]